MKFEFANVACALAFLGTASAGGIFESHERLSGFVHEANAHKLTMERDHSRVALKARSFLANRVDGSVYFPTQANVAEQLSLRMQAPSQAFLENKRVEAERVKLRVLELAGRDGDRHLTGSSYSYGGDDDCYLDCNGLSYFYAGDFFGVCDSLDGDYSCFDDCGDNLGATIEYYCACSYDLLASYSYSMGFMCPTGSMCTEATLTYFGEVLSFSHSYSFSITNDVLEGYLDLVCTNVCSYSYNVDPRTAQLVGASASELDAYIGLACNCDFLSYSMSMSYSLSYNVICSSEDCISAFATVFDEFATFSWSMSYSLDLSYAFWETYLNLVCGNVGFCTDEAESVLEVVGFPTQYLDFVCECGYAGSMDFSMSYPWCESYGCLEAYTDLVDMYASFSFSHFSFSLNTLQNYLAGECSIEYQCAHGFTNEFLNMMGLDTYTVNLYCDCMDYFSYSFSLNELFYSMGEDIVVNAACDATSSSDCYDSAVDFLVEYSYASTSSAAETLIDGICPNSGGNDDNAAGAVSVGIYSLLAIAAATVLFTSV